VVWRGRISSRCSPLLSYARTNLTCWWARGRRRCGHKKIYVALPRLLTLWFDYTQTDQEKATPAKDVSAPPHCRCEELRIETLG
jgi:hypothetical protein